MNIWKAEEIVSATLHAHYAMQESVVTIDYDPTTGESRISTEFFSDPVRMDDLELMNFLDRVEAQYPLVASSIPENRGDQPWLWEEDLRQLEELCDEIAEELVSRIRAVRDKNCVADWCNYVDDMPSMGLERPEDFLLYWYIHREFPQDMELCDLERVHRVLQDQLDKLLEDGHRDEAWCHLRRQKEGQLQQIREMMTRCIPEDDGVRMEHGEEDEGEPFIFAELFFAPDTAELNQKELVGAIEQMQCHLLSRESEREGDVLQRSAWEFERSQIQEMLDELNRRILRKIGVVELQNEEEGPKEFRQDHSVTSWIRGRELETAEDIIACWYLSDAFPWGLDFEQMVQILQKLKEQMQTLEAEEFEYEALDALDLWRFRRDIKAEQLEQIQNMMWNYSLDYEE